MKTETASNRTAASIAHAEQTWAEIGYRIRPLRATVFVRTDPPCEKVGSLYITQEAASFYSQRAPHAHIVQATVLSAGPRTTLEIGDRICFQRLHFAWLWNMPDHSVVGYVADASNLVGYSDDEIPGEG